MSGQPRALGRVGCTRVLDGVVEEGVILGALK